MVSPARDEAAEARGVGAAQDHERKSLVPHDPSQGPAPIVRDGCPMNVAIQFPLADAWVALLQDLDIDIDIGRVLRRACLPEDLFARDEPRIDTDEYFRLWKAMEAEADDPEFALRVADRLTAEVLPLPMFAALCSPNLLIALERLARYKLLVAPVVMEVHRDEHQVRVVSSWLSASELPPTSLVELGSLLVVRMARMATRERIQPLRVTSPRPPRTSGLERFLGVQIEPADQISIAFSREDCERPALVAKDAMWRLLEPELRLRLERFHVAVGTRKQVEAALLELLPDGRTSVADVASRLVTSRRTLQRRLRAEGTSYLEVLRLTREKLAMDYLLETDRSCTEISSLLGFEGLASFSRAFNDWTGRSPQSVRRSQTREL